VTQRLASPKERNPEMVARIWTVALFALVGLGCDDLKARLAASSAGDAGVGAGAVDASERAPTAASNAGGYDVCALLPAEAIKQAFPETKSATFEDYDTSAALREVKANAKTGVKVDPPKYKRETRSLGIGSVCHYSYPKPDADEIEKRNKAKTQDLVAKQFGSKAKGGAAGGLMSVLSQLESSNVNVTLGITGKAPAASSGAARVAYDDRIAKLRAGFKGKDIPTSDLPKGTSPAVAEQVKGIELAPDDTLKDVAGVGDAAAWSERTKVLQVLSGRHLFTMTVDAAPGVNRDRAIVLARGVIARL
jgi:hypothetical protein